MSLSLSKPLFVALCASIVASIAVTLAPKRAESSEDTFADFVVAASVSVDTLPIVKARDLHGGDLKDLSVGFVPYRPPPPRIEPKIIAPEKPAVPTPHFLYLGRMDQGDRSLAFIGSGENVEALSVGERIDYNWRIEKITDNGVVLTYLPLNEQRSIFANER